MFAVCNDVVADGLVVLKVKLVFLEVVSKGVQIPFSDLFGSKA